MARRRSARLASATQTKKTTAPNLDSVAEREESPADDTVQSLAAVMSSPIRQTPQTPSDANLIKPPKSEMHPAKYHNGTMPAPSSALRLGFTDIKPKTTSTPGVGAQQSTPSKSNLPSSPFAFSLVRNTATAADSNLGPEALRMMTEIRDQAAKIKAELVAQRELEHEEHEQVNTRKIAKPKGKAGRYSDVHMSQFRKMDSIENHPSAFRAAPTRATPAAPTSSNVKSLKRTQSKANLDDNQTPRVKTAAQPAPSRAANKLHTPGKDTDSPAKRVRKHLDDDASTNRPVSREGSNIPRPKTPGKDSRGIPRAKTLANLMSPTQASLARAAAAKTPTTAARSLLRSPSKINLTGLKKSTTTFNLESEDVKMEDAPSAPKMRSTSLSDRVKSMFAKHKSSSSTSKHSIPKLVTTASKTPAPPRTHKDFPPAPFTTPGKRIAQRGDFTPAPKHAALAQNSPSPVKTGIPRSKLANNLVNYPSLDAVLEGYAGDTVSYPDLSGVQPLSKFPTETENSMSSSDSPGEPVLPPAVPGTFTLRSDHTIRFDSNSPNGFGANLGQSSVRQVRPSMPPPLTGNSPFPNASAPSTAGPRGKENVPPYLQQPKQTSSFDPKTFAHGVSSKKRHRVEDDEEEAEREAAERAAKKARSRAVPEGEALVAPRLASARKPHGIRTPSKIMKRSPFKSSTPSAAASPSVGHRSASISLDRLAYLAQPKQRK
ncbi:hypothetical protein N0V93_004649 [Gnomoniopsis smithogilvyi]|uniref:Erythromycin esterase n=1 Tax=Gnomoniopsis smithogilvyi TaxID=1191159 RepID=A0A9W8YSZ4_9PEZI|nr:hypothetical protein N0V93_004649 [Gnomoniopsis smithogilvyi]